MQISLARDSKSAIIIGSLLIAAESEMGEGGGRGEGGGEGASSSGDGGGRGREGGVVEFASSSLDVNPHSPPTCAVNNRFVS